jgi:NAD(P)-dependent dehydrogenase (short-subunit alcohol dehydrogenase family)
MSKRPSKNITNQPADKLIAAVTGATKGIGLAIAGCLLKRGASVAVTYRGDDKAAEKARRQLASRTKTGQRILLLKGDVGIFVQWSQAKKNELKKKVFGPRIGVADDVVRAFEYLPDSPFVTGVTLDVNGGAFMI